MRAHSGVDRIALGERGKRRRHVPPTFPDFSPATTLAEAAIDIAQRLAHERVGVFLAQLRLQRFDERNQHLGLYLGLLYEGNVHASPPWTSVLIAKFASVCGRLGTNFAI